MRTFGRDRARAGWRRGVGLVAALTLLAGGLGLGPLRAGTSEAVEEILWDLQVVPLEGATPPPFTLPGLDGQSYAPKGAAGRVVVLYFWASW